MTISKIGLDALSDSVKTGLNVPLTVLVVAGGGSGAYDDGGGGGAGGLFIGVAAMLNLNALGTAVLSR